MAPTPELADAAVHDATSPANGASQKPRRNSIAEGLQLPTLDPAHTSFGGSSKRRRSGNEDECDEFGRVGQVDSTSHSSKRRRSSNWPLTNQQQEPGSPDSQRSRKARESYLRRHMGSPTRMSKFREASMHDRASDKPPSFFTRFTKRGNNSVTTSVDQLMEDYHSTNTAAAATAAVAAPTGPRGPSRGSSHQRAQSISSGVTNNTAAARDAAAKDAGIFKFGRSIAANFNPVNLWQKLNQKWQDTRQEMLEEDLDDQTRKILRQRAARAEEQYAKLKAAGQLGKQGTYGIPSGTYVYTPGYAAGHAAPADRQRDSGISGIDPHQHVSTARPYSQKEASKSAAHLLSSPPPAGETTRKSALHFRTPSFANLKRARSEAHLGQKRLPPPPSSPAAHHHHLDADFRGEPADHGHTLPPSTPNSTLRRSASKRDLQKQLKLSKRVSDLELKLKDARRELYQALGDSSPAPPLPPVPSHLAATLSSTSISNTANTPRPRVSPLKKKISDLTNRHLPTLPSGRLLSPEQADAREDALPPSSPPSMRPPPPDVAEDDQEDELAQDNFPTNPTPHLDAPTTATADIWLADVASPALAESNKLTKQPKKRGRPPKKRKAAGDEGDLPYKPPPQTWKPLPHPGGDDEDELLADEEVSTVDPPKRKRGRPRKNAPNNENADPKQKFAKSSFTDAPRSSFASSVSTVTSQTTLTVPLKDAPPVSTARHMTPGKSASSVVVDRIDDGGDETTSDAVVVAAAAAPTAAKRVDSGSGSGSGARSSVVSVDGGGGGGGGGGGKGSSSTTITTTTTGAPTAWTNLTVTAGQERERERPKSAMASASNVHGGGDDDTVDAEQQRSASAMGGSLGSIGGAAGGRRAMAREKKEELGTMKRRSFEWPDDVF
ncbi:hypothetical protein IWZ03DRAFT_361356 [Phyllosticta citriasiana]|uniref:Nuclear RNA binding protein n=1 Tax=Phyllosticta citriasiana TaxID=595635 RepID=A0ABR1KHJ1_9PEZI